MTLLCHPIKKGPEGPLIAIIGVDLQKLCHRNGRVSHAAGKAPFIVIPAKDAAQIAVHHFGLIRRKD